MMLNPSLIKDPKFLDTSDDPNLKMLFIMTSNDPKPALNPTYPRLYGQPLCPYVERTRLALAARGV